MMDRRGYWNQETGSFELLVFKRVASWLPNVATKMESP